MHLQVCHSQSSWKRQSFPRAMAVRTVQHGAGGVHCDRPACWTCRSLTQSLWSWVHAFPIGQAQVIWPPMWSWRKGVVLPSSLWNPFTIENITLVTRLKGEEPRAAKHNWCPLLTEIILELAAKHLQKWATINLKSKSLRSPGISTFNSNLQRTKEKQFPFSKCRGSSSSSENYTQMPQNSSKKMHSHCVLMKNRSVE